MENPLVIIEVMRNIHADNDFFEKVLCEHQRRKLRGFFFISIHLESRLDIDFFICVIYNEVNLLLHIRTAGTVGHDAYINGISPAQKLVVEDVFHHVAGIVLAITQSGIAEADIRVVVFVRLVDIGLPFHIIALCHRNKERIDDVLHIVGNQCGVDLFVLHAGQRIGYIRGIRQGTDL